MRKSLPYIYPILIIASGLIWLLWLDSLLQLDSQTLIFPDSKDYLLSAQELFFKFNVHAYRPILMAFLSGFPFLFGSTDFGIYQWSFVVNLICWLATALLLFEITRHFLQKKHAFVVAISYFFIIGLSVITYHLLTECLYTFCVVSAFYFLFKYDLYQHLKWLCLAVSILFLSVLIKPGSILLAIAFGLFFIKKIAINYKSKSAFFVYFSLLLIATQVIGMRVKYGDFKISYIDGVTYYNYLLAKSESYKSAINYSEIKAKREDYIFSYAPTNQKNIALTDLKKQLQDNPINIIKAYISNVIENTKTGSDGLTNLKNKSGNAAFERSRQFFFSISKWQNRIFTVVGIGLAFVFLKKRKTQFTVYGFMSFYVLYIVILSGISSNQGDRFHLVTFPIVLVLFAKWISSKYQLKSEI
jgi:hypothetical protein